MLHATKQSYLFIYQNKLIQQEIYKKKTTLFYMTTTKATPAVCHAQALRFIKTLKGDTSKTTTTTTNNDKYVVKCLFKLMAF